MRLQLDPALTGTSVTRPGETAQTAPAGGLGAASGRIGGDSGDSIQISGASSALNRLSADRAARIQQLTALVQGGSYQVSGAQVGRAMVDHAVSGAGEQG
jgi:anti-sigma28 factor (negative regulator of flagellin synthesis)